MSSLENLWPDPSVNKEIRRGGFGLPAGCQVAGFGGAHLRKFRRARRGGFAAITPQQSGAATTSVSVIGTPCFVATSLLLRQGYGGQVLLRQGYGGQVLLRQGYGGHVC